MSRKTILVDPERDYEIMGEPQIVVEEYNRSETDRRLWITVQDQIDINEMLVESGILVEVDVH